VSGVKACRCRSTISVQVGDHGAGHPALDENPLINVWVLALAGKQPGCAAHAFLLSAWAPPAAFMASIMR